jgi:hypothetical protein
MVTLACNPSYLGGGSRRISSSRFSAQEKLARPYLKKKKTKYRQKG